MLSPMLPLLRSRSDSVFYETRAPCRANFQFFFLREQSLSSEPNRDNFADRVSLLEFAAHYFGHFGETVCWRTKLFAVNVQLSLSRVRRKNIRNVCGILPELLL